MAASGSKKKTKTSKSSARSPLVSTQRKLEVLGLVLMVLALLLTIAFVSYQPEDNPIARSISLQDALFNPAENQAQFRVRNGLGIIGAEIARVMVPGFLGYMVLVITGILMSWGYAIFRHLEPRILMYGSGLAALSAFLVATLIGWFGHVLDLELVAWCGTVGMGVSGWMQRIFGATGSLILLLLGVAVMLLLVVDHDIQRSVDRVVEFVRSLRERTRSWYIGWSERREERRAQRQAEREALREERESANRSRAQSSDAAPPADASTRTPHRDAPPPATKQKRSSASANASGDASPADGSPAEGSPAEGSAANASASTGSTASRHTPAASNDSSTDPNEESVSDEASVVPGMTIRNDLFRDRLRTDSSASSPGDSHASSAESGASTSTSLDDKVDDPEVEERAADFGSALDSVQEETGNAAKKEAVEPTDDNAPRDADPDSAASPHDVELQVQEQVEEEKAEDIERLADVPEEFEYTPPSIELLDASQESDRSIDRDELEENKRILLDKLETYNINIQDIKAVVGPTVTRYELTPAPGIKVSRIKSLEDDLAMAMAAQGIRMIAPIPGKSAIGVEIPNRNRELVRLREVIGTAKFRDTDMELPFPLGKSIEGEVFLADLTKMPHLLIAGATGSGKSVGLNALLTGLIYACHPSNLKFVIIDPKKIELQQYSHLEDHFIATPADLDDTVITDVDEALGVLKSCEKEMEKRYDLLSEARVRGIRGYNRKFNEGKLDPTDGHEHMPYIVVVVDELADLMMTAGKEIEGPIARLAQMARAVGIHLVLATQRPSVDVITGLIKANFPSRIAYEVASRVDSRTILDQIGAEGLVGNGDLLYLSGSKLIRLQGPFVSVEEVERIVDSIADQPGRGPFELPSLQDAGHGPDVTLGVEDTDDLFEEGARVIVRRQQGSVSLLQRKLAVGYTRAARIVDQLEEAGIVGPFNGTKARDVLVEDEEQLDRLLSDEDDPEVE